MYEKLKEIQQLLWKNDDLMDQDTLFELQDKFAKLTLEIAEKENKIEDLIETFSWLYNKENDNIWGEIRNDYYDEDEDCIYIDAWITDNDNEEGKTIAVVYKDNVAYADIRAKYNKNAQEIINEAIEIIKKY